MTVLQDPLPAPPGDRLIRRHSVPVRVMHWINVVCLVILVMSGLGIFNGWPALYWGIRTRFDHPLLALYAIQDAAGHWVGMTYLFGHTFVTTGWLGLSAGAHGQPVIRGFPSWATIPGPLLLALSRRWHFFFAWIFVLNGLAYALYTLLSGHLRRDLMPTCQQARHIGRALLDHLRLRFPKGEEARHYNVLQKFSYLVIVFGLGPLMLATGLTMSPWIDAAYPQLLDIFGGRQSARTIHFLGALALVAFVIVHIAMVVLSGPWNNMRAMITGRYRIADKNGGHSDER
ncbi:MAG: cytochrome b/b6 domain-containing protein [Acetobacteraceae bacterium]